MAKQAKRRGRPPGAKSPDKMDVGALRQHIEKLQSVLSQKVSEQRAYFEEKLSELTGLGAPKKRGRPPGRSAAKRKGTRVGLLCVNDTKRHRGCTGAVRGDEVEAVGAGLLIDEIIDVALAVDRDLPGLVTGDRRIAHQVEQRVQLFWFRMGVFDELETIGAHRIVGADRRGRRVVRKWTHADLPDWLDGVSVTLRAKCMQSGPVLAINMHNSRTNGVFYS